MKAYPKYKASGIDWLGDIPSHWIVKRIKHISQVYGRIGFRGYTNSDIVNEGEGAITLSPSNIIDGKMDYSKCSYLSWEKYYESPEIMIFNGDILFVKTASVGKTALVENLQMEATINPQIVVLKNIQSNNRYLAYLMGTNIIDTQMRENLGGSTILTITQNSIENYRVPVPPIAEQEAIAAYLDETVAKIDALISEKRKQVEDIRAYRTSLITETVTRGLNPEAPLRPSGIDWLGNIPKHWNVVNLKYLINEPLMYGANESPEIETNLSNPRYIRITDIDENGCLKKNTFRTLQLVKAQPYLLKYGDILFARSGATVGKTYRFTEDYPAAFAGYLIKASCGPKIDSLFLLYYTNTQCYNNWKNSIFDKSTIQNIAADKYNNLPIVVPPLAEQKDIADFLDAKTAKIDELISEMTKQIDELSEYKQAVITEAVTGKVDVSDYKPLI